MVADAGSGRALRLMSTHHRWALERLFAAAEGLSAEAWTAPAPAALRPLRETLLHMSESERRWLAWVDGTLPLAEARALRLEPADYPDAAAVRAAVIESAVQLHSYLEQATAQELARPLNLGGTPPIETTVLELLLHVMLHRSQHRTEAAAILTAAGHSPGDLDVITRLLRG